MSLFNQGCGKSCLATALAGTLAGVAKDGDHNRVHDERSQNGCGLLVLTSVRSKSSGHFPGNIPLQRLYFANEVGKICRFLHLLLVLVLTIGYVCFPESLCYNIIWMLAMMLLPRIPYV